MTPTFYLDASIRACNRAAIECGNCAEACSTIPGLDACWRMCRQCEDNCRKCLSELAKGSTAECAACAEACELCANECSKHQFDSCRDCASACRDCATACFEAAGQTFCEPTEVIDHFNQSQFSSGV